MWHNQHNSSCVCITRNHQSPRLDDMDSNKHDEDKRLYGNVGDSDDGDKDARDVDVDDVQPVDVDDLDDLHLDVVCVDDQHSDVEWRMVFQMEYLYMSVFHHPL